MIDDAEWRQGVDLLLLNVVRMARLVTPLMEGQGGGSIVNIASILGLRTIGQVAPYNASKAAVHHLTRTLAAEWADRGVRVYTISFGTVEGSPDWGNGFNGPRRRGIGGTSR